MSLPTLTWAQSGYTSTGQTAPTDQQVLDALDTAIGSATYWEKKSAGAGYLEIGPKTGSAIPNFKALLTIDPTTGYGSNTTTGAGVFIGIAPDGGTLGSYQSATPYGSDRFSKYWRGLKTGVIESVYLIENDEMLCIVGRDDSLDNYYICIIGAIIDPLGSSAEADGRVYGITTTGQEIFQSAVWNNDNNLFAYDSANNNSHTGIFRPTSPTIFETTRKIQTHFDVSTNNFPQGLDDKLFCLPFHMVSRQNPRYMAGQFRQMYVMKDSVNRTILNDSQGVAGYCLSNNASSATDAILFANS